MKKYVTPEKVHLIDGKPWTVSKLAEFCGITRRAAHGRINRFRAGEIDTDSLFHHGNIRTGGAFARVGNDEWKALSDRERKSGDFKPGTWEREHIKEQPRREYTRFRQPADAPVWEAGQFKINLGG